MLSADNDPAHKDHWKAFLAHPEWDRIKRLPKYKDTVSNITIIMLSLTMSSDFKRTSELALRGSRVFLARLRRLAARTDWS